MHDIATGLVWLALAMIFIGLVCLVRHYLKARNCTSLTLLVYSHDSQILVPLLNIQSKIHTLDFDGADIIDNIKLMGSFVVIPYMEIKWAQI